MSQEYQQSIQSVLGGCIPAGSAMTVGATTSGPANFQVGSYTYWPYPNWQPIPYTPPTTYYYQPIDPSWSMTKEQRLAVAILREKNMPKKLTDLATEVLAGALKGD